MLLGHDGYAYAMFGATGAELWKSAVRLGDIVQAAPAAILSAYGGLYDYALVGSRNSAANNAFYALNKATGGVAATFDNGGGAAGIGIISGMASVDNASRRVFFASRARAGGSNHTLWCLQIGSGSLTKVWSVPVGDIDGSVVVRGGVVYVGNNAGQIHAVSAADGTPMWGSPLAVGSAVKGFLFPNRGTTTSTSRRSTRSGASATTARAAPSSGPTSSPPGSRRRSRCWSPTPTTSTLAAATDSCGSSTSPRPPRSARDP